MIKEKLKEVETEGLFGLYNKEDKSYFIVYRR